MYPSKALNNFMGKRADTPEAWKCKMIVLECVDTHEHFLKGKIYKYLQTGPSKMALFTSSKGGDFSYSQFRIDQMVADGFLVKREN